MAIDALPRSPARAYLAAARERAGVTRRTENIALGALFEVGLLVVAGSLSVVVGVLQLAEWLLS